MARARIISNKAVTAGGTLSRGDEVEGVLAEALVDAGSAEWVEGGPEHVEPEPEPTVLAFASDSAAELAEAEGLGPADFQGLAPSGRGGYTKADVQSVVDSRGGDE